MSEYPEFVALLCVWILAMAFILWGQRKDGSGSGLVLSYALQLCVTHWLTSALYSLPWYDAPGYFQLFGLRQSTLAITGFAIGSTILLPFLMRRTRQREEATPSVWTRASPRLVRTYLAIGLISYFVLEPQLHFVPTIGAIAGAASNLLLVGLTMEAWNGLHPEGSRQQTSLLRWAGLCTALPVFSMVTKGYLGYGLAAMLTMLSFSACVYRPRWKLVGWSVVIWYLSMSLYVTYIRDRQEIREVVWGQDSYSNRLSTIVGSIRNFEFLDPRSGEHLDRIERRMNQDGLVGAGVAYLNMFPDKLANGRTLWEAVLSPVPRILWPEKPTRAGSGDMVSEFTGLSFQGATSVGIGHVLEWYVNFASNGVFFGMMGIGVLIGWLDRHGAMSLRKGDWAGFVIWWLPGLSLLQVGGSFVDALPSAGAGLLVALMLRIYWSRLLDVRQIEAPPVVVAGHRLGRPAPPHLPS